ncbi:hypothetical protein OK016_13635 [Vibrio chagasii]|nr:hypothetical protein [Vibrio chagasii]
MAASQTSTLTTSRHSNEMGWKTVSVYTGYSLELDASLCGHSSDRHRRICESIRLLLFIKCL